MSLILINAFWGWSNYFGNLIQLLPTKGLYFEILMLRSMTRSLVQSEPFPSDSWIFGIIMLKIDSNTSSISISLITASVFQVK